MVTKDMYNNIDCSWNDFFEEENKKDYFISLILQVTTLYLNKNIYPNVEDIFKPFKLSSYSNVKVIIIGQDPYHTKGVADGLAFSSKQTNVPPSLRNIFKELKSDLDIDNTNPCLDNWAKQGVLLLNTVLTVEEGLPNSHSNIGWNHFIINFIEFIDREDLIFVLWGNRAKSFKKNIKKSYCVEGYHPSPLAGKKFFGEKYFSQINNKLVQFKKTTIDWRT